MLKSPIDIWMLRTNCLEKLINRGGTAGQFPDHAEIRFCDRAINRFFHHRYAPKEIAHALGEADSSMQFLATIARNWRWAMGQMHIARGSILASPSRGTMHKCHSLTGKQLKEFLPGLVSLAKTLDELPELHGARALRKK